ncbi:MAG: hypothetical protein ACKOS8_03090, partial [Gemmataceae bacterium]
DAFTPLVDSRKGFSRVIKVQSPGGAYLRVASGKLEKKGADFYELDGLKIKSAGLMERGEGDKKELLLPLKEGANTVEYAW